MKNITMKNIAILILACLAGASHEQIRAEEPAAAAKFRIVLVGDSTVTDGAGWGKGFADAMTRDVEVINLSKGGRSSSSFIKEGSWKKALDLKPDYVLVQFGHNDQPGHGDRETDPATTYKDYMTTYVREAKSNGIKAIVVTPLSRRQWDKEGKIRPGLLPWADVAKTVAMAEQVPVVDLHALSIAYYEKMGSEKILEISPFKNADPKNPNADTSGQKIDGTHLNEKGGRIFGSIVAGEVKALVPELAPYVRHGALSD